MFTTSFLQCTFKQALSLVQTMEAADHDTRTIHQGKNVTEDVQAGKDPDPGICCTHCGGAHKAPDCRFINAIK